MEVVAHEPGILELEEPDEPMEPERVTGGAPGWLDRLRRAAAEVDAVLAEVDPDRCDVDAALGLLGGFARLRKVGAAGEALLGRRVEACRAHERTGHPSTAHLLAELGGTSVGRASEVVETSRRLAACAATDEALRSGAVSVEQATAVTKAAVGDPGAEDDLLALAQREPLRRLETEAREVRSC